MKTPNEWTSLIVCDLRGDQTAVEQHEVLSSYILLIQNERNDHLRSAIHAAHGLLAPLGNQVTPSVLAIREALHILRTA